MEKLAYAADPLGVFADSASRRDEPPSPLQSEWELFKAAPDAISVGVQEKLTSLAENPSQFAKLALEGAAIGLVLAHCRHNPDALWGAGEHITKWAGKVGAAFVAKDLAVGIGTPAIDTWNHPSNLELNKKQLGSNLGSAAVEYTTMGLAGMASYKHIYSDPTALTAPIPKPAVDLSSVKLGTKISDVYKPRVAPVAPTPLTEITSPKVAGNPVIPSITPILPAVSPTLPLDVKLPSAFEPPAGKQHIDSSEPIGFSLKESEFENFGVQRDRFLEPETTGDTTTNPTINELFAEMWEEKRPLELTNNSDPHAEIHDPWMQANNLDPYGNVIADK